MRFVSIDLHIKKRVCLAAREFKHVSDYWDTVPQVEQWVAKRDFAPPCKKLKPSTQVPSLAEAVEHLTGLRILPVVLLAF